VSAVLEVGGVASAQSVDLLAVAPPLLTALAAMAVLVADLFLPPRRRPLALALALGGVAAAALSLLPVVGAPRSTFCVAGLGPDGCSYTVDALTVAVQALVLGGAAIALLLSVGAARDLRLPPGEHAFLLLCATTGALALAGARDLLTLVVALEVSALPGVALVALRREDRRGGEAGLKLFLVSVAATAVTLFGLSLVYAVTGEVYLARIASSLADSTARGPVAAVGVVTAVAGFAVKVAAVPFHVWAPDTYAGAPVPVAAYLSVVSKAAGVVGLLLLLTVGFPAYADTWAPVLAVLAAATMTVGNLVALRQRDAVRLLAWSAVAQSGFILVPLGAAVGTGVAAVAPATVAYLLAYGVVTLGAFSVVALVVRRTGSTLLAAQRGLARSDPWLGGALAFALLGLAGLPPGVLGLFAKVVVVAAPVTGGPGWLAVVAAVNIVLALAYYLSWTALLLARPADPGGLSPVAAPAPPGWALRGEQVAVGLTLAAGVVLSIQPGIVVGALQ
jgi:NADH-quinone oxidoreductase subunit N